MGGRKTTLEYIREMALEALAEDEARVIRESGGSTGGSTGGSQTRHQTGSQPGSTIQPGTGPVYRPVHEPCSEPGIQPPCKPPENEASQVPLRLSLTKIQDGVLRYFIEHSGEPTSRTIVGRELGLSPETVRTAMKRLVAAGLLEKPVQIRRGAWNGFRCKATEYAATNYDPDKGSGGSPGGSIATEEDKLLKEKTSSSSVPTYNHTLKALPDVYPGLHSAGFTRDHFREIAGIWKETGRPAEALPLALERADHLCRVRPPEIRKPLSYVLKALRGGEILPPEGFKSKNELWVEELEKIDSAERERASRACEEEYRRTWEAMSDEERREIDASLPSYARGLTGKMLHAARAVRLAEIGLVSGAPR